jgi:hypothetical protein
MAFGENLTAVKPAPGVGNRSRNVFVNHCLRSEEVWPSLQHETLLIFMSERQNWIDRAIENYRGKFLEPKHGGLPAHCPLDGPIGVVSLGGELYCPTCHEWFPSAPTLHSGSALEKKQVALQARLGRKAQRANRQMVTAARKQVRLNRIAKKAKRLGVDPEVLAALTPAQQDALEAGRRKRIEQSKSSSANNGI